MIWYFVIDNYSLLVNAQLFMYHLPKHEVPTSWMILLETKFAVYTVLHVKA